MAESHAKVEAECSPVSAFGVLVKCASAVPRSVQAGGWSPFRDVYGCVVAKWLHAIAARPRAPRGTPCTPLRGARRVEDLGLSGSAGPRPSVRKSNAPRPSPSSSSSSYTDAAHCGLGVQISSYDVIGLLYNYYVIIISERMSIVF